MSTFSEIIHGDKPVLVDFFAEWCGPCKSMSPVLKQIAGELGDKVRVIKIDIDKNRAAAEHYQVSAVPTFLIIVRGKVVWRQSGALPAAQLLHALNSFTQ